MILLSFMYIILSISLLSLVLPPPKFAAVVVVVVGIDRRINHLLDSNVLWRAV